MDPILNEIRRTLSAELWYAAITLSLTLPDICATLQADSKARKDGQKARYKRWCRDNIPESIGYLSDDLCWELRCGVVHEGRLRHRSFDRIRFTVPPGGGVHNIVLEMGGVRTLTFHVPNFCNDLIYSAEQWYARRKDHPNVKANIDNLVQPQIDGLLPLFDGVVVIG